MTTLDLNDRDTIEFIHELLVRDEGHLRCPCSYARNGDEAAWYGLAMTYIYGDANGWGDSAFWSVWNDYTAMAVNDSSDLLRTIVENWDTVPEAVRDHLAEDRSEFITDHFDYLVSDDQVDEMQRAYLDCGLWATPMPDETGTMANGMMQDHFAFDEIVDDSEVADNIKGFIAMTLPELWDIIERHGATWASIGHDFLLTREGHGAGFWDRGYYRTVGNKLSAAAHTFGSADFMPAQEGFTAS